MKLDFTLLTPADLWKLPRFDSGLPKPRKGVCWRKKTKTGWLIGEYIRDSRRTPLRIEWHVADLSGEAERILRNS